MSCASNDYSKNVELLSVTLDAEKVIEQAGRTCYLSFDKIGASSSSDFIQRLIKLGHESPLEHAYASFRLKNCSRAMTHQLVRHRLVAVSQQSQRYVNEDDFSYVIPETVCQEDVAEFEGDMKAINAMYRKWREKGLKREDARYVLPNACTSEMVISANFRQWRHIFQTRLSPKAQWEIRNYCQVILEILQDKAPNCFLDFE